MWKANGITSVDTQMPTSLTAGYGKLQLSSSSVTVTSPFISSDAGTGIDAVLVQTGNLIVDDTSGGADQITITDTTAGAGLTIGGDTNLYRSAANTLKTDDSLAVTGNLSTTGRMTAGNIASGIVTITPVANSTTGVAVTGLTVRTSAVTATQNDVSILVTASSQADALRTTSASAPTFSGANLTGFTVNCFRTNTTTTGVWYFAIGR